MERKATTEKDKQYHKTLSIITNWDKQKKSHFDVFGLRGTEIKVQAKATQVEKPVRTHALRLYLQGEDCGP